MALDLIQSSRLIKQGAEARIYIATLHPSDPPVLLKHRFEKKYRHSALDASLTRSRISAEARAIVRCLREGINVPAIRLVDAVHGLLGLELIEGKSVRQILPGADDDDDVEGQDYPLSESGQELEQQPEIDEPPDSMLDFGVTHEQIMDMIGVEIAKMHVINLIHGDLTTSNMMLRRRPQPPQDPSLPSPTGVGPEEKQSPPAEIVLIDFGLTTISTLAEDKAVDLYVLERAFSSTHPDSEGLFQRVLDAYARQSGRVAWAPVHRRLDEGEFLLANFVAKSPGFYFGGVLILR